MSSFYKSNLMDSYDTLLIPPEDVQKKEENNDKSEVNVETNKAVVETLKSPVTNVDYPYKNTIKKCHLLITMLIIIFTMYWFYVTAPESNHFDDNEKYLYNCGNATNVMSLDKVEEIKHKLDEIRSERYSINTVASYNISSITNIYLTQKLVNLTATSNSLKQQFLQQQEIRFICYKDNLEKKCEEESYEKSFEKWEFGFLIYISNVTFLLGITFYYISKARKCNLSPEQQKGCDGAFAISKLIIYHHFSIALILLSLSYLFSCDVERELGKFSM